ncbi:MAG: hypothetical protein AAGD09_11600 [Cyanobacteria bacterium P01_F01_bin.56]
MPWIEPHNSPDYLFLATGELQYRDRCGQFRICGGCTGDTWFTFLALRDQAVELLGEASEASPEELYLSSIRFRWLCDECLTFSGIDPKNVTPRQAIGLLFAQQQGDTIIPAPLVRLSEPPARRHPPIPGSDGQSISDKAGLIAALISQGDGAALLTRPMREALAIVDDMNWAATPLKDRHKAKMLADAENSMSRIDDFLERGIATNPKMEAASV